MTEVTSYTELIRGIDEGRIEMGVRHLDFEVLCSMTQGHWGKAAGMLQVKRLGIEKIFDALRASGLRMKLEVDPEQRAKMMVRVAKKFNPMSANQARPRHSSSLPSSAVLTRVLRPIGKLGGKARWAGKSKAERAAHGKLMVMAREKKRRAKKRAARARAQGAAHRAANQAARQPPECVAD